MTRLAEIQGDIASMGELLAIVGAMRSLAGMRVQEAQRALPGIRRFAESVRQAVAASLLLLPQPAAEAHAEPGQRAFILCAAEHGFAGAFTERLLEAAAAALQPQSLLFVLGSRGSAVASERGWKIIWSHPMATRLAGAPDVIDRLAGELYARIAAGQISSVEVMFSRYSQGVAPAIERRSLLPLDTATRAATQPRQAPLHNLPPTRLLETLMAEYMFALLTEAAVESIASENAARFAAMQSAHDNVTKKLTELHQSAQQARQTEITSELLDVIIGAEAVSEQPHRH
jgi:F-type H+-transporting ATPase subunit gamma